MRPVLLLLLLLTVSLLPGCKTHDNIGPSSAKQLLTPAGLEILRNADHVQTARVFTNPKPDDLDTFGLLDLKTLDTINPGPVMDAGFARRLADILVDDRSYLFNSAKGCKFKPIVRYHFRQGERRLAVVLCFSCDEAKFILKEPGQEQARTVIEDIDPARAKLVRLTKEAFPDDREITALKE